MHFKRGYGAPRRAFRLLGLALLVMACSGTPAEDGTAETQPAQTGPEVGVDHTAAGSGEALYQAHCAACHDQAVYKAPSRLFLSMLGPQNVLDAMNSGLMQEQAASLSGDQRLAVAEYVTGQSLADMASQPQVPACGPESRFDPSKVPVSLGWGVDAGNSRFQPAATGGLEAGDLSDLEVKWAFAYPNSILARSQPVYGGGAIYFGSNDGTVRALDAETGCLRWRFKATAEIRNALVIAPWEAGDRDADPMLYFGDIIGRAYALRARTGELVWLTKLDDHPFATMTGAPALAGGTVFAPVSSLEVASAFDTSYECCTFRGSVVALDAETGAVRWKTHTIDQQPGEAGKTRVGTRIFAPSGAPVWTSPTVDVRRNRIYIGTGENYSSPSDGNSDAIMALDMGTGEKLWVSQQTRGDAWNTGCLIDYTADDANCPEENGPDFDFGSSPMLVMLDDGSDVLIAGQKSGDVMAINPDTGETLWKQRIGRGGVQGGVHFGMAAEGRRVYVPINDMAYPEDVTRYQFKIDARPGLYAVDAATGELLWSALARNLCGEREGCDPGISHAITAVPGAVIAGYLDGHLRIHDGASGEVLWELDTVRDFATVSGATARGGSFSGGGAIVANGMIYVNSGYGIYGHMPGNVLLALGPADP